MVKELHDGLIGEIHQRARPLHQRPDGHRQREGGSRPGRVRLGPVSGTARRTDFRDNLVDYNWHWFWDWGTGETGNNATHEFDVARWILQVGHPESVFCNAGKYYYTDDDWTMYDTMDVTLQYPGGKASAGTGRAGPGSAAMEPTGEHRLRHRGNGGSSAGTDSRFST
ncbi:MAG: hypothetical protein R2751_14600 [Bacteroidales bacterium]